MRLECIPVWLEVNEQGAANAYALNTCCAVGRGESASIALARLRGDLGGTRKWLATHGVNDLRPIDTPFRVIQRVTTSANPLRGESRAFFDWDGQLLGDEEITRAERVLHCARCDVLSLVEPASEETLDVRLAPRTRTIREIVRHVAARELWLATCLLDDPFEAPLINEFGHEPLRRLRNVRLYFQDTFLAGVRRMSSAQRMRQQLRDRELWSARKALRSAVQHEIYHLKQVYRMLQRIRRLPGEVRRAAVA